LTTGEKIQTALYADDQVIIAKSEDELQMTLNEQNKIIKKYDVKISSSKMETIGFCGRNVQRVKIEIEGKITEQVSNFNYLGYLISSDDNDISVKVQRYNKMNGIIKCHCGKHMTTDTKLQIHNVTSKAALCYGSENWIINKRDAQKLEAAKMRFLRPLLRPYKIRPPENPDIRNRLKVNSLIEDIKLYQKNWLDHLE
jgi:hypothetical protein